MGSPVSHLSVLVQDRFLHIVQVSESQLWSFGFRATSSDPSSPCDRKYVHASHPSFHTWSVYFCVYQTACLSAACCCCFVLFFVLNQTSKTVPLSVKQACIRSEFSEKETPGVNLSSSVNISKSFLFEDFSWLKGWSLLWCLVFPLCKTNLFHWNELNYDNRPIKRLPDARFSLYPILFLFLSEMIWLNTYLEGSDGL